MNQRKIINRLVRITGANKSRVIDVLKKMSTMPEVQEELKKQRQNLISYN